MFYRQREGIAIAKEKENTKEEEVSSTLMILKK